MCIAEAEDKVVVLGDQGPPVEAEHDRPRLVVIGFAGVTDCKRLGPLETLEKVAALQTVADSDDLGDRGFPLCRNDANPAGGMEDGRRPPGHALRRHEPPHEILVPDINAGRASAADHEGVRRSEVRLRRALL